MISEEEKRATVRMFETYCRHTLRNAQVDALREKTRHAKHETLFCDMSQKEHDELYESFDFQPPPIIFDVSGYPIAVNDVELADALSALADEDRSAVLLFYFAGWSDRRIGNLLNRPRSTVQFRRTRALATLKTLLDGERGRRT